MPKAVVLLSGGQDSATCLAIAKKTGYDVIALSFDYGSTHDRELDSARALASYYDASEHIVFPLALDRFGGSALLEGAGPEAGKIRTSGAEPDIPSTYVPARNIIFLSVALALAEAKNADAIYIGANSVDYSGYPDCRPEFLEAFRQMSFIGTKRGTGMRPIIIEAPLLLMSKGQIVKKGIELGVPYELTWSCYKGGERACGKCDACRFRLLGFAEAGSSDPIAYESEGSG